jgi:outer membrane protein
VSDDLNSALDGIVSLPEGSVDAELDLDNSVGLAAQVGLDYMITENILINGTVWWMDIDTEATIYTSVANVTFDVDIDPFVYLLSIGYRF